MHRETHKNPEAYTMLEDTRLEARDTEQERRSRRYLLDSLSQIKEVLEIVHATMTVNSDKSWIHTCEFEEHVFFLSSHINKN